MKNRMLGVAAIAALFSSPVLAADLPARQPIYKAPPAAATGYDWNGVFIGGHLGWGWQRSSGTILAEPAPLAFPLGTVITNNADGFLGGAQIGVNWQRGNWVFGLEGDFSWTNASGAVTTPSPLIAGTTTTGTEDYKWFATVTGRVGRAWDNWLVYAKGGAAWVNHDIGGNTVSLGGSSVVDPLSETRTGWTVGAGVEQALGGNWSNWSWKLEYNYMDFGTHLINTTTTPGAGVTTTDLDLTAHALKFGINYRLGRI